MTLESYLQELQKAEDTPKRSLLINLSSLDNDEMDAFKRWWPSIPDERRREIMEWLVTIAEDNVDLDFDAIFRYALDDPDSEVRGKAISGLWECDDRTIIAPLMELLKADPEAEVRAAAAVALGKFSILAETGKILSRDGERIKDLLLEVIDNPMESIDVRRRSLESVACYNTPRIRDLIRWAYHSDNAKLRISSLFAMGKTADSSWLSILMAETQNNDPAVRYETAAALAEIGEEDAVPYVIPLLQDDDAQVQLMAIQALGAIGGSLAERALRRSLRHEDEAIRDAAHEALEQLEAEGDPLGFKFRS